MEEKGHKLKVKRVLQNLCWLFMSPIMNSQSYWQLPPKLLPQMIGDQIGLFGSPFFCSSSPCEKCQTWKSLLPNYSLIRVFTMKFVLTLLTFYAEFLTSPSTLGRWGERRWGMGGGGTYIFKPVVWVASSLFSSRIFVCSQSGSHP